MDGQSAGICGSVLPYICNVSMYIDMAGGVALQNAWRMVRGTHYLTAGWPIGTGSVGAAQSSSRRASGPKKVFIRTR
jgi:hypothetical protein